MQGSTLTYNLPAIIDPENDTCIVKLIMPTFATVTGTAVTFTPSTIMPANYTVELNIEDGVNNPLFRFYVKVSPNTPAIFVSTPVVPSTPSGVAITYTLPGTSDAESNPVTIGLTAGGPSFVNLSLPNVLNINPPLTVVGSYNV